MFHKCFDLIFGNFELLGVFNWLFVDNASNICCDGNERVDLLASYSKCLYEWVVFSGFFIVCGVWESVTAISEFNELYDIW